MSDLITHGPKNPSRLIFVATALAGAGTGLITRDLWLFTLAVLACASLLCLGYAVIRRRLGWAPLRSDDLFEMLRLLSPH